MFVTNDKMDIFITFNMFCVLNKAQPFPLQQCTHGQSREIVMSDYLNKCYDYDTVNTLRNKKCAI